MPSSPPSDLAGLPDVASVPTVPGASAYIPSGEKIPAPATPPLSLGSFEFHPNLVPEVALSPRPFDPQFIRRDFPILQEQVNGRPLVWLDNAATTQKPNAVIDRLLLFLPAREFEYSSRRPHAGGAGHRCLRRRTREGASLPERALDCARLFLFAAPPKASTWSPRAGDTATCEKDDEIVITWLEHHANIVPVAAIVRGKRRAAAGCAGKRPRRGDSR